MVKLVDFKGKYFQESILKAESTRTGKTHV